VYVAKSKPEHIAIFIPSYKEDSIILHTAQLAASHDYPQDRFWIFVIADHLKPETIEALKLIPQTTVIPVSFDISTKAKSLQTAMSTVAASQFPITMILDADNVMADNCLYQVNEAFRSGARVVQCHRTAKNQESAVSLLDGISEEINNNIFRKGHIGLGVASALIGSGFVIQYKYCKDIMLGIESPVEDKELEILLLRDKHKILYESDAYVFDEKVASSDVFMNQRRRWIASQFFDFNKVLFDGIIELLVNKNKKDIHHNSQINHIHFTILY
jgi:cellulose synthase/poly-beta-1,6-N-acetylglucosamine synthase-like glycosyltransferase